MVVNSSPIYLNESKYGNGKFTRLSGNKITKLNAKDKNSINGTELRNTLHSIDALVGYKNSMEFVVNNIEKSSHGGYRIRFRQTINSIPIDKSSYIETNADGVVKVIRTSLIDPESAPRIDVKNQNRIDAESLEK